MEKRRGVASSVGKQLFGRSKLSRRMGVRDMASAIADLPFKAGVPGVECRSSISVCCVYVAQVGAARADKERCGLQLLGMNNRKSAPELMWSLRSDQARGGRHRRG